MPKYYVACRWDMAGEFEVEADSLKEAIAKVESEEGEYKGLPEGEYVDDSFTVVPEDSREIEDSP